MKNEITVYELLGLIKDNKAPKKIKYDDIIWEYSDVDYNYHSTTCVLNYEYILNILKILNDKVEILSKENDEWEDIEDITLNGEVVGYGILKEWLDFTPNDNEQKICSCIETLGIVMNKLIKNQKYLKEKLESKNGD